VKPSKDHWQARTWRRRKLTAVVPTDDMKAHDAASEFCWCRPERKYEGRWTMLIHNAMDGRELVERHGLQ